MIGEALNHYQVLEKIGEGGMGQVYLAEDTRLHRRVALKVLPAELAGESDRIERFEREARTVAALNHPNIVTIFSVEEAKGVRFLTMELVDGKSLDDLIPLGGLELEEFFALAVPLASATAAAHRKGITHRDIKPANVMVNSEDVVKLLDLGLAKLRSPEDEDEPSVTQDQTLTRKGRVIGTVPYMAPEQLSAKPTDHRVDIFALGIVLYQILTGVRPFQGDSSAELISSILRDGPTPLVDHRATLPAHLDRVIRKCLEKDPERRFDTAAQLRDELRALQRLHDRGELIVSVSEDRVRQRSRRTRTQLLLAVGVALGAAILAGTFFSFPQTSPPGDVGTPIVVSAAVPYAAESSHSLEPRLDFPTEPPAIDPQATSPPARRPTRARTPQPDAAATVAPESASQQATVPATERLIPLRLSSAISSGVVTLYSDELQIYRRAFQFEERKKGLLGRVGLKRRIGGEVDDSFTVPDGTRRLRLYVALAGLPAQQFIFESSATDQARLVVEIDEDGEIAARFAPGADGD